MQWLYTCFSLALCLWVPGDGSSAHQARRKNPDHHGGSNRYRTSDEAPASSSGLPKKHVKRTASKQKEKSTPPDEMSGKEFSAFRMWNPYPCAQDDAIVGHPFWTKEQSLIYMDILKAKKNLFVNVKSIDVTHMEKDPAYFGEALALCQ